MSIGSGKLIRDNLPKDRVEILDKIHNIIEENFRNEAKKNSESEHGNNKSETIDNKRYNNVISILGGRGSGKTSMGITVLKELIQENIDISQEKNIVLDIIDPAMFNIEKNSLGWVLYLFNNKIEQLKKAGKTPYCTDNDISKIEDEYKILKEKYLSSRVYYKNSLAALSDGRYDFQKVSEKSIFTEISLEKDFKDFIYKFIECWKLNNESVKKSRDEEIKEPLIFITFDDVDLSPQVGPEILENVLNYLDHPNIVVFILGDYDTFKGSIVLDLWNKSKVPEQIDKHTIINKESILQEFSIRAEDILGKVLPPAYRFELEGLSLEDRLKYTPMGDGTQDKMIKKFKPIRLTKVTGINWRIIEEDLINWFIEPMINVESIRRDYNNIKNSTRTYDGFDNDGDKLNKYIKQYEKRAGLLETFINAWKDDEALVYQPKLYANVLPDTPRSLISLYNDFEDIERQLIIRMMEKSGSGKSGRIGYEIITKNSEDNFILICMLYDLLKKNNISLNNNIDKYDMEKIIRIDKKRRKIKFDFSNLKFKAENGFKYFNFNCSQDLLKCVYITENNIEYELDDTQSAFIQLIYDLALNFLTIDEYIEVEGRLDFSNITLYKNENDNINISMINTRTFREYYTFMKLYELCVPVINQDRRVHRNIRTRLKRFIVSALSYIIKERSNKSENLLFNLVDNIEEALVEIWSEFYENNSADIVDGKMSTLYFLRFFEESSNPYEFYFDYYINSDNDLINYSRLASLINNTIQIEARTTRITEILEEVENFDYSNITIDNSLIKTLKEANKTKDWNRIRLILFEVESVFVLEIGLSIFHDYISPNERRDALHKLIEIYTNQKERIVRNSRKDTHRYNQRYNEVYERLLKLERDMYGETQNGVKEVTALIEVYKKVNINQIESKSSNTDDLKEATMTALEENKSLLIGSEFASYMDNRALNDKDKIISEELVKIKQKIITYPYVDKILKVLNCYDVGAEGSESVFRELFELCNTCLGNRIDGKKMDTKISAKIQAIITKIEVLTKDENNE